MYMYETSGIGVEFFVFVLGVWIWIYKVMHACTQAIALLGWGFDIPRPRGLRGKARKLAFGLDWRGLFLMIIYPSASCYSGFWGK
jgi:hypothetical protein